MIEEIWKPVRGTKNIYWVSNQGRVKSYYGKDPAGRIMRQLVSGGYLTVGIHMNGIEKKKLVHRLVADAFCRKRFNKIEVDHLNGRRLDNRAVNLEWVTPQENMRRAHASGTIRYLKPGEGSNRRLTEQQVVRMKHEVRSKELLMIEAAEKYGISILTVIAIMQGKRWSHIP